jgi:hypothetical protein
MVEWRSLIFGTSVFVILGILLRTIPFGFIISGISAGIAIAYLAMNRNLRLVVVHSMAVGIVSGAILGIVFATLTLTELNVLFGVIDSTLKLQAEIIAVIVTIIMGSIFVSTGAVIMNYILESRTS